MHIDVLDYLTFFRYDYHDDDDPRDDRIIKTSTDLSGWLEENAYRVPSDQKDIIRYTLASPELHAMFLLKFKDGFC